MGKPLTIGVLGGMGPQATNYLCAQITAMTPANTDQEHIPVISFNNAAIPSRLEAVLQGATSPLPELVRTARVLEAAGADFIVIPCNTAHFYLADVSRSVSIPFLDMIQLTVDQVLTKMPEVKTVGILASSATIESRLYLHPFMKANVSLMPPTPPNQRKVMDAIYGDRGIKASCMDESVATLEAVGQSLLDAGADVVLAGCTEISLAFAGGSFDIVDPVKVVARAAVERALAGAPALCKK